MTELKFNTYSDMPIFFNKQNLASEGCEYTVLSVEDDLYYSDLVVCKTRTWPNRWTLNLEFGERKGSQIKVTKLSLKALEFTPVAQLLTMVSAKHLRSVKRWEK